MFHIIKKVLLYETIYMYNFFILTLGFISNILFYVNNAVALMQR